MTNTEPSKRPENRWHFECRCGKHEVVDVDPDKIQQLVSKENIAPVVASSRLAAEEIRWVHDEYPEKPSSLHQTYYCSVACLKDNIVERLLGSFRRYQCHVEMNMEHLQKIDVSVAREAAARLANELRQAFLTVDEWLLSQVKEDG